MSAPGHGLGPPILVPAGAPARRSRAGVGIRAFAGVTLVGAAGDPVRALLGGGGVEVADLRAELGQLVTGEG